MPLNLTGFQRQITQASFDSTIETVSGNLDRISSVIKPYYVQYCSMENPMEQTPKCSTLANALDQIDIAKALLDESIGYFYSAIGMGKSPRMYENEE